MQVIEITCFPRPKSSTACSHLWKLLQRFDPEIVKKVKQEKPFGSSPFSVPGSRLQFEKNVAFN
jgi:hypothetical protein